MTAKIILLSLLAISLGIAMAKHGQDKGKYNVWYTILDITLELVLLYYAGFFNGF